MKKRLFPLLILLSMVVIGNAGAEELVLTAGPANGSVAQIGFALAAILTDDTVRVKAVESAGDTESIARVVSGSADLAVVDSLAAYEAALGIGRFTATKKGGVPAAAVVGLSVQHFLLIASTQDPKDITALSGKILYLGPDNDDETYAARTIISASGIESFFEVGTDWNYETAAELMIDGTFDGAVFSGVVPLRAVSSLTSTMGTHVVLLSVPDEKLADIRNRWPIWFPYVVSENTYPAVDKPYETVARPILLLAAQGLENVRVKAVLSRLYERAGGPAPTGLPYPLTESMTRTFCPIKLHPGAAEYFKEHGY
jgi:TRAP transporter TAXI family solute receptor